MGLPRRLLYAFDDFAVDPVERVLLREGQPVHVTPKAFEILLALVETAGHILDKDALMARVWAGTFVEEGNLKVTVSQLRKVLRQPGRRDCIETIARRGYRFVAPIRRLEQALGASTGPVRIAVLPLENRSGDPAQEYFSDGLTDVLIGDLARISGLRVISRTSVMRYKHTRKPLGDIARELQVTHVLEGSVVRAGTRVRINVQLIDASTDCHVWASSYHGDVGDTLHLQSEIARATAGEVKAQLTDEERSRLVLVAPVTPEALEAYLQGRHHLTRLNLESLSSAISCFEHAIARDPAYAPAYGELGGANVLAALQGARPDVMLPRARAAAERALEINPDLPEALTALGEFEAHYRWDLDRATAHLRHAMRVSPSFADAHARDAGHLVAVGRFEEAFAGYRRAQELDPLSPLYCSTLALGHYCAKQPHAVMHQAKRALSLDANLFLGYYWLGLAWEELRNFPEAVAALEKAAEISPGNPLALAALGHVYAVSGRCDDARAVLATLAEHSDQRFVPAYQLATVHAGLNDAEATLGCLERSRVERDPRLVWANVDPRLEIVRDHVRFQVLVKAIGLSRSITESPSPTAPSPGAGA